MVHFTRVLLLACADLASLRHDNPLHCPLRKEHPYGTTIHKLLQSAPYATKSTYLTSGLPFLRPSLIPPSKPKAHRLWSQRLLYCLRAPLLLLPQPLARLIAHGHKQLKADPLGVLFELGKLGVRPAGPAYSIGIGLGGSCFLVWGLFCLEGGQPKIYSMAPG